VIALDGYEADDLIGTLVHRAETEDFRSTMVTPDKDFGQLVTPRTVLYRPGRMGGDPEILDVDAVCARWGIREPRQLIDILGLMGDMSDNIPGVPGIGEKTAAKLIAQFGSLEALLDRLDEVPGKVREKLEQHREQALLSKHLATIDCDVPLPFGWSELESGEPDSAALRDLLIEFEFNSIGRRLLGPEFKAGRGFTAPAAENPRALSTAPGANPTRDRVTESPVKSANLRSLAEVTVRYQPARGAAARAGLWRRIREAGSFALAVSSPAGPARHGAAAGIAFAVSPGEASWVALPPEPGERRAILDELRPLLEDEALLKAGHDLKSDAARLRGEGLFLAGPLFDSYLAHALIEPDLQHSLEFLSEARLGYSPISRSLTAGNQGELGLDLPNPAHEAQIAMERADLAVQLRAALEPGLRETAQERVFCEIEMPLVPVLVDIEHEGVRVDAAALREFSERLSREMNGQEEAIQRLAGTAFNVNSPKQLGEVLFERLRLVADPKKTRTGQYATDESTLVALAGEHEIVRRLLDYRTASKLKSTYADALPAAIDPRTDRVHTTFRQLLTATGRLSSQDPNLQNIPIRTELGREIRRAFVARDDRYALLSADYSQIELRIIAALSREPGLIEAFQTNADVHTATAARVFGVAPGDVTPEMRKKAKMVNYGIAYGISAFGLAQRLGIPRKEAAAIIDHYYAQFPGIREFMQRTIETCRQRGYVETVTGRRRYLPEIASANATVRAAAERNAINAPIQGTAADMIKLAMIGIHRHLRSRDLRTRMLLQVHDELLFDLYLPEEGEVRALVEEQLRTALPLDVPIVVEMGVGQNWLEAH
jgi:DNA polymerase I